MTVTSSLPANWTTPWKPDPEVNTGGAVTGAHIGLGAAAGIGTVGTLGLTAAWLGDGGASRGSWARLGRSAATTGLFAASAGALLGNARKPDDITDGVVQGALLAATVGTGAEAARALTGDGGRVVSPTVWKNAGKIGVIGGALATEYAVAKPFAKKPDSATDGVIQGALIGVGSATVLGGAKWLGLTPGGSKTVPLKIGGVAALNLGLYGLMKEHIQRPESSGDGAVRYGVLGALTLPAAYIGTRAIVNPSYVTGRPWTRTLGLAGFTAFVGLAGGAVAGSIAGSAWPHKEAK